MSLAMPISSLELAIGAGLLIYAIRPGIRPGIRRAIRREVRP
jgi:hypothetical protein